MKIKYIFYGLLLTSVNMASAQDKGTRSVAIGQSSIGIFGGVNFQNINGKDANGNKLANSLVPRYHFGFDGEIGIAPEFYLLIGLQFISKGTKGTVIFNDINGPHSVNREIKMNYLEMPLHLEYKPLVGMGHLILGFGPYVGYSIGGKVKFTGNSAPVDADVNFVKTVPEGDANNLINFKRLDVGSDFFVGYEFQNGINIVLKSQLGLININSNTSSKLANKNTGFGLSLGYRF